MGIFGDISNSLGLGDVDSSLVTAGLLTAGSLIQNLFAQDYQDEQAKLDRDFQERQFQAQQAELALQRQERERQRQLELETAAINARLKAGMVKPDLSGYSNAASNQLQGASIENTSIANIINALQGMVGGR